MFPRALYAAFDRFPSRKVEPLNTDHETDVRRMVEGEVVALELRDPDAAPVAILPASPKLSGSSFTPDRRARWSTFSRMRAICSVSRIAATPSSWSARSRPPRSISATLFTSTCTRRRDCSRARPGSSAPAGSMSCARRSLTVTGIAICRCPGASTINSTGGAPTRHARVRFGSYGMTRVLQPLGHGWPSLMPSSHSSNGGLDDAVTAELVHLQSGPHGRSRRR